MDVVFYSPQFFEQFGGDEVNLTQIGKPRRPSRVVAVPDVRPSMGVAFNP